MTTGTVNTVCKVYNVNGTLAMQAQPGDVVEGNGVTGALGKITKLTRRGVVKLSGAFYLDWGNVTMDIPPVVEPPLPPVPPTPRTDGKRLAYVYTNWELGGKFYNVTTPIPDTRPYFGAKVAQNDVSLTAALQWWWYDELASYVPTYSTPNTKSDEFIAAKKTFPAYPDDEVMYLHDYKYLLNDKLAFCNFAGSDTRHIYPGNLNPKAALPIKNCVTMGGSVIELVDGKVYTVQHRKVYAFYVINASASLAGMDSRSQPYRWFRPAITYGAVHREEPFSTYLARARVPMLLTGTNIAFIDVGLVKVLGSDEAIPAQFSKDWA